MARMSSCSHVLVTLDPQQSDAAAGNGRANGQARRGCEEGRRRHLQGPIAAPADESRFPLDDLRAGCTHLLPAEALRPGAACCCGGGGSVRARASSQCAR